jgi:RNA polymerase sigma-54 factor
MSMRPVYGMVQQQAAKMMMTPQLQQVIKILQLSTSELLEAIQQELGENPVLEFAGNEWGTHNGYHHPSNRGMGSSGQDYDPLHHAAWNDVSLERHLQEQLSFIRDIPPTVRKIIMFMIGNLDDKGYLLGLSLDEISDMLQVEPDQAELALKILQRLRTSRRGSERSEGVPASSGPVLTGMLPCGIPIN